MRLYVPDLTYYDGLREATVDDLRQGLRELGAKEFDVSTITGRINYGREGRLGGTCLVWRYPKEAEK